MNIDEPDSEDSDYTDDENNSSVSMVPEFDNSVIISPSFHANDSVGVVYDMVQNSGSIDSGGSGMLNPSGSSVVVDESINHNVLPTTA